MNSSYVFEIDVRNPARRIVQVKLQRAIESGTHYISMPVWTPGSYLVRDFPKHVFNLKAKVNGERIEARKVKKHTWLVKAENPGDLVIEYSVYAHDLSVRTSYLSHDFALLNLTSILMFHNNNLRDKVRISLLKPDNWKVSTGMKRQGNELIASDLEEAFDSPILAGELIRSKFEVDGKPHNISIAGGRGNFDLEKMVNGIKAIVSENQDLYGELPYERYEFLIILSEKSGGGLEHRNSNVSMYPRLKFLPEKDGHRFFSLEAHEHFHTWLVKRIKPKAFMPYNYLEETYTHLLWVMEGVTSYYDNLIPVRAGISPVSFYLKTITEEINQYEQIPGKTLCSLEEASFNAWIGLYKPDENTPNIYMSYYLKGGVVTLLLDMYLRSHETSMDRVMRFLWENYGKQGRGIEEDEMQDIVYQATGVDVNDFFKKYVKGTDGLPYELLNTVGLTLENKKGKVPRLGVKAEGNKIRTVFFNSPAQMAGLAPGDVVLAFNNIGLENNNIQDTLKRYRAGEEIEITLLREGVLHKVEAKLGEPLPNIEVKQIKEATEAQKNAWKTWIKRPWKQDKTKN